ncbi:MAG: alpha-1,4-glucan--maltose-1-phosphate maltosyltransferase [Syntrophotaleaceae bacterium]
MVVKENGLSDRKGRDLLEEGKRRVVIENLTPQVDCGRFPIKRVPGEPVLVEADIFSDGHDEVRALLLFRDEREYQWHKVPMTPIGNDRWQASFIPREIGICRYTVEGYVDHFRTWKKDLEKKYQAGQDLTADLLMGIELIRHAVHRAGEADRQRLAKLADTLADAADQSHALALTKNEELAGLMDIYYDPELASFHSNELKVVVERTRALFSSWYELFPRSCGVDQRTHGTFADCEKLLPEIARMGFDVIYFPPIHPIGRTRRKGKNNATEAGETDPGCPWAIGAEEGGHRHIHPHLGTLAEFLHFLEKAREFDIEVALDVAFQCSPDHPFVKEHPEWFRWRPDGTVQFAENPPKKYEDIVPFDFETDHWRSLWEELKQVVEFWIDQGVSIFRVDNPHTKPFAFWEYLIREIRQEHPETIFLSEAFTRPKVMYRLAKLGFSQSYTYFSWRNTRWELEQYLRELSSSPVREFFRPNFWPNTPDILPEILQYGGKPAFVIRLILAATLSASYGIYGPPFELFVNSALPGREEYLDSEKYQIRRWNWDDPEHLRDLIARLNAIRRQNPVFHSTWNLHFCESDNDNIICYLKSDRTSGNHILTMVNMDPFNSQSGSVRVPVNALGIEEGHPFLVDDLLSESKNIWHTAWNQVELDPQDLPARVCRLYPRLRREQNFDYFM